MTETVWRGMIWPVRTPAMASEAVMHDGRAAVLQLGGSKVGGVWQVARAAGNAPFASRCCMAHL